MLPCKRDHAIMGRTMDPVTGQDGTAAKASCYLHSSAATASMGLLGGSPSLCDCHERFRACGLSAQRAQLSDLRCMPYLASIASVYECQHPPTPETPRPWLLRLGLVRPGASGAVRRGALQLHTSEEREEA